MATWDTAKTRTVTVVVSGTARHSKFTVDAVVVRGQKKGGPKVPPTPTPAPTPTANPTPARDSGAHARTDRHPCTARHSGADPRLARAHDHRGWLQQHHVVRGRDHVDREPARDGPGRVRHDECVRAGQRAGGLVQLHDSRAVTCPDSSPAGHGTSARTPWTRWGVVRTAGIRRSSRSLQLRRRRQSQAPRPLQRRLQRPTPNGGSNGGSDAQAPTAAPTAAPTPAPTAAPTPAPTPPSGSRPFPAPVTTRTVSVPTSIDATGSSDVSAALNAFIKSVPDGSIIAFRAGTTYRLDRRGSRCTTAATSCSRATARRCGPTTPAGPGSAARSTSTASGPRSARTATSRSATSTSWGATPTRRRSTAPAAGRTSTASASGAARTSRSPGTGSARRTVTAST